MRFTISPEQIKFFHESGYLALEQMLTEQESFLLQTSIKNVTLKSPGYVEQNFFRSIPFLTTLARKRGWGEMAYELIHKKPLRISYDAFFSALPVLSDPLDENSCGLVLDLTTCNGLFFKEKLPERENFTTPIQVVIFSLL